MFRRLVVGVGLVALVFYALYVHFEQSGSPTKKVTLASLLSVLGRQPSSASRERSDNSSQAASLPAAASVPYDPQSEVVDDYQPYNVQRLRDGVRDLLKEKKSIRAFIVDEHNKLDKDDFDIRSADVDWVLSLDEAPTEEKREVVTDLLYTHAVRAIVLKDENLYRRLREYYYKLADYTEDDEYLTRVEEFLIELHVLEANSPNLLTKTLKQKRDENAKAVL